jgi:hypothetical protein
VLTSDLDTEDPAEVDRTDIDDFSLFTFDAAISAVGVGRDGLGDGAAEFSLKADTSDSLEILGGGRAPLGDPAAEAEPSFTPWMSENLLNIDLPLLELSSTRLMRRSRASAIVSTSATSLPRFMVPSSTSARAFWPPMPPPRTFPLSMSCVSTVGNGWKMSGQQNQSVAMAGLPQMQSRTSRKSSQLAE